MTKTSIAAASSSTTVLLSPRLQPWDLSAEQIWALAPGVRSLRCLHAFARIVLLLAALPVAAQQATLKLPETGANISITFGQQPDQLGFGSFRIVSGSHIVQFAPQNPVARIPGTTAERLERGFTNHIDGLKLDPSRYFFAGSYIGDSAPHTLLFFVGEAGVGAAPVMVVGFAPDGKPYKVLERDALDVTSFQFTSIGPALIIGKTSLSEVMWSKGDYDPKLPYATTYDPYSVFVVNPNSAATYSLSESRKYNQQHYAWAGPKFRKDYAVAYNIPGHRKPFALPASQVDSLAGGKAALKAAP